MKKLVCSLISHLTKKLRQVKCSWSGHGILRHVETTTYTDMYGEHNEIRVAQCMNCQRRKLHVCSDKGKNYTIWI